jgi:Ser/Thr protein kinase RdoA (MazF antagonist)
MTQTVLSAYGFKEGETNIEVFGKGLINNTWKVTAAGEAYILQRINDRAFKQPRHIANNIKLIKDHLDQHFPGYNFVAPVASMDGDEMVFIKEEGFFRLFPFVKGSHSKEVVETPRQAYEAAAQFGRFTRLLSAIDIEKLKITIPDFHNLSFRFHQFEDALKKGNKGRIDNSKDLIRDISGHSGIVRIYAQLKTDPAFRLRVTHHDTKISNVLFDKDDKGLCVIDLDTVMPGYFISDVGDMLRTYLSPVSEEEKDPGKIEIREAFYKAIVQGYRDEMKDELTEAEMSYFFYAGQFMIYMQAVRFLTDHINDDVYYGAGYPGHNYIRAKNQLTLLNRLLEKKSLLADLI